MTTLSYSIAGPALRSPVEEWQPHGKQSESTTEWWYLTATVHDTAGNLYFLARCPFHFTGEKTSPASAHLPPNQRAIAALTGFTDYRDTVHIGGFPAAVVNEADTWEPKTNSLRFVAGDYRSEWSYNGDTMHLTVASPVFAAILQRRSGQSVQLRQRLPGRDLSESRRLLTMAGLFSCPPERLPQDARARSMAVMGLELRVPRRGRG